MKVIKRISGLPCRFGGVEHSGWLPPNAAMPPPTPVEEVLLDLEIIEESDGYVLYWSSREGRHQGDLWFQGIEDAQRQALRDFGAEEQLWQDVTATKTS